MPSLKSRLFSLVLRLTRKKSFQSVEGLHKRLAAARETEDYRPPKELRETCLIEEREVGGFPVYELRPRKMGADDQPRRRLLYLHGGAFLFEITPHHWRLIEELARRLDAAVTVPIYPLAPEHTVLDVYAMMMPLYRELATDSTAPPLTIVGDSAGGAMAATLAMMAAKEGIPRAANQVLMSACFDMTGANPDARAMAKDDPWLDIPGAVEAARLYAGDLPIDDWRISPLYGDLSTLPPTLAFIGTKDILLPDTKLAVDKTRALGVPVDLEIGEGMFHVWPLLPIREGRAARDRMVAWIESS